MDIHFWFTYNERTCSDCFHTFFADSIFYYSGFFVQKFGLDRPGCPAGDAWTVRSRVFSPGTVSLTLPEQNSRGENRPGIHNCHIFMVFYPINMVAASFCGNTTGQTLSKRKKVKKGVDFILQTRYNVCLYGKLEEGGAIHAQH